jgi:hypothetical protein
MNYGSGYNEDFVAENDRFQDYVFMLQTLKNEADRINSDIYRGCLKLATTQDEINKCQTEHTDRAEEYSKKFDEARKNAETEHKRRLDRIAKYWDRKSPSVLRRDGQTGQVYSQRPSGIIKVGPKQTKKPVRIKTPRRRY